MPLNSVQNYVKTTLSGLVNPQLDPLQAVISDPVWADVASAPIAYIWAGRGGIKDRQSAPRPIAWQHWQWSIDISVLTVMNIDDPNLDTAFPLLLDQIVATLATTPIVAVIADPVTGFESQVVAVGEQVDVDYARLKATGSGGEELIRFGAEVMATVKENVSFMRGGYYNPGT